MEENNTTETENLEQQEVEQDNPLKQLFINYVGSKLNPENGQVTAEMCVQALADEFPEFLLLVAQENFIRGYRQCIADLEQQSAAQPEQKQE